MCQQVLDSLLIRNAAPRKSLHWVTGLQIGGMKSTHVPSPMLAGAQNTSWSTLPDHHATMPTLSLDLPSTNLSKHICYGTRTESKQMTMT